ncbi:MAG TPA: mechanosensitive ion channel family protein [Candidatus Faecousia intestinigallinarum]|nr:mechanosensitive ion channel family protein [Candidatus Faecousia intestinigallinarum]
MDWQPILRYVTNTLIPVLLLAAAGLAVIRLVQSLIGKALQKSRLEHAAYRLIHSLTNAVLYLLLGLILASRLGIDVSGIVALASVLTLAVSLAVQNAIGNVIGGFTLLYTKPFKTDDFVEIAGNAGTVTEISMTYTKLVTPDNRTISIPNSAVTAGQIINYTALGKRRAEVTVFASYEAPVERVLSALLQAAKVPTALDDPAPFAAVKSYDSSAITYLLHVWSVSGDYWTTLCDVRKNVKAVFDREGIPMTYPHLNVHVAPRDNESK